MALIQLTGVRRQFGGLVAVDGVDLAIESGEIRGLIGPNGSGKTTLLNLMSGWLPPTGGRIIWRGQDVTGLKSYRLARKGIVRTFQLSTLFRDMTALQNVVMGYYAFGSWNPIGEMLALAPDRKALRMIQEKALELLAQMGIADIQDELAGKLSLGHQRWLGMAVALSVSPALLMLDEPLGGMNPVEKTATMQKIRKLRDSGITILLVEHDMNAVMGTCGKVTVMNAGRKIAEASPNMIRNNQNVVDAYLGDETLDA